MGDYIIKTYTDSLGNIYEDHLYRSLSESDKNRYRIWIGYDAKVNPYMSNKVEDLVKVATGEKEDDDRHTHKFVYILYRHGELYENDPVYLYERFTKGKLYMSLTGLVFDNQDDCVYMLENRPDLYAGYMVVPLYRSLRELEDDVRSIGVQGVSHTEVKDTKEYNKRSEEDQKKIFNETNKSIEDMDPDDRHTQFWKTMLNLSRMIEEDIDDPVDKNGYDDIFTKTKGE